MGVSFYKNYGLPQPLQGRGARKDQKTFTNPPPLEGLGEVKFEDNFFETP